MTSWRRSSSDQLQHRLVHRRARGLVVARRGVALGHEPRCVSRHERLRRVPVEQADEGSGRCARARGSPMAAASPPRSVVNCGRVAHAGVVEGKIAGAGHRRRSRTARTWVVRTTSVPSLSKHASRSAGGTDAGRSSTKARTASRVGPGRHDGSTRSSGLVTSAPRHVAGWGGPAGRNERRGDSSRCRSSRGVARPGGTGGSAARLT